MHHRFSLLAGALLLLILLTVSGSAMAELARIVTPGGPVKMRKKPSSKASVVVQVPNNSFVELDEAGEEWCHVTYKGRSGYIMTDYVITAASQADSPLALSYAPQTPSVGCRMDFTAVCEGAVAYRYTLAIGSGKAITSEKVPYDSVSFRPRQSGISCLEVTAWYADGSEITNQLYFEIAPEDVSCQTESIADTFVVFSQKDGWWQDKKYRSSDLDTSGCAIFTLAHALQHMGFTTSADRPEELAVRYAFCLVDGGTLNSTLIGRSAKNYGFSTKADLISSEREIVSRLEGGAMFTFAIVRGHIALIDGLSEDGTKVRIVDSAPSVTLERISGGSMYIPAADGAWQTVTAISEIPGARYYFETDQFGGLTYYLDLKYVARRGVRLIQPAH